MNPLALLGFAFVLLAPVLGAFGLVQFRVVARGEHSASSMLTSGMWGVACLLIGSGLLLTALPGSSLWTLFGVLQVAAGIAAAVVTLHRLRTRRD